MTEPVLPTDDAGIARRELLAMGGASISLATLAVLMGADAAFGATIGDPWTSHIKSWNWNWADHRANGYLGGQDYAYEMGIPMYAPTAGTLGSGSGGTSTFTLDQSVTRIVPAEAGESGNIMVALQFLHQSAYGTPGHYNAGAGPVAYVGMTGAAAPHWHVHGLSSSGGRVDWRKFVSGSGPIINPIQQGVDMHGALVYQCQPDSGQPATGLTGAWFLITATAIINLQAALGQYLATRLNCDTIAQSQASGGVPFTMSQNGFDYLAAGLGAPTNICETLYTSSTNKVWRAPAGTS